MTSKKREGSLGELSPEVADQAESTEGVEIVPDDEFDALARENESRWATLLDRLAR